MIVADGIKDGPNGIPLVMHPPIGFAVTGGPPLSGALSLYPFGIKESPNGTSLAMYPLVDFAFKAQGYVSKGRRFLSDAPFGRFP